MTKPVTKPRPYLLEELLAGTRLVFPHQAQQATYCIAIPARLERCRPFGPRGLEQVPAQAWEQLEHIACTGSSRARAALSRYQPRRGNSWNT